MDIKEIRKPEVEAKLVAENIANQHEKRVSFRRAMKKSVQSTMRLGAKGRASSILKPFSKLTIILEERAKTQKGKDK